MVLLLEWSSFRGGLKAGFYCTYFNNIFIFIFFLYLLIEIYLIKTNLEANKTIQQLGLSIVVLLKKWQSIYLLEAVT